MCGIIGVTGIGPAVPRLIDSLKRLEYRGYDSAGVAALVDGRVERRRAKGKIAAPEDVLAAEPLSATVGIGHTRWATHGAPTTANAQPHKAGRVTLVHNGGDSGGVIASVFQPFQAVDQPGNDGSIAGDADDAAHALGTPKRKETEGRRFALAAIRG